jgi:hypothetical protein
VLLRVLLLLHISVLCCRQPHSSILHVVLVEFLLVLLLLLLL